MFDFKEQLTVGDRGQELFIQHYHSPLVIVPEHKVDFKRVLDNRTVELKTDTYNMDKSPNFFFERWSDVEKKKPGGPWQSLSHKVDIFCYLFVRHNVYFEFTDLPLLCKTLEDIIGSKSPIWVKNRGWITAGYKVPREAVKHLYTEYRFNPGDSSATK